MSLTEGQIFEGEIGSFGHEAPRQQWIVVSSFGKLGLHAISDPLDHHFMSPTVARMAIAGGKLIYSATNLDHPVVKLQREKEARQIRDTHMSVSKTAFGQVMALLEDAVADRRDYAPYLAGEFLAMLERARHRYSDTAPLVARVNMLVGMGSLPVNVHTLPFGSFAT